MVLGDVTIQNQPDHHTVDGQGGVNGIGNGEDFSARGEDDERSFTETAKPVWSSLTDAAQRPVAASQASTRDESKPVE